MPVLWAGRHFAEQTQREVLATVKKRFIILLLALVLALQGGCSVALSAAEPKEYVFDIVYDGTQGNAWSESKDGYYAEGTTITAHAGGSQGKDFMCWSIGGYLADGGTDISHDADYTFTLSADTWLYANFKSDDLAIVRYHTNGGTVTDTGEDVYEQQFSLEYYLYPNTLASMDYFQRDGYTLISYNTKPDGSGEAFNLGGKALIETNGIIDLYCIWAKQTDEAAFSFERDDTLEGWFITGYNGHDETVCLPESYRGESVLGLAGGALDGADMKTLVIPDGIQYVRDGSCTNCLALEKLYIFDSLTYISDAAFDGCDALKTYYFNAATPPRFTTWFNNHTKKIEVLCYSSRHSENPRIICVGGSSTTYAVDCEHMEEALDGDWTVINFGTNGANLWNMTAWWVMRYLNEGDVVLQLPEYSAWQLGGVICRWETFRSFEGCYNVFSWVDGRYFYSLLDCFCEFLEARKDMDPMSYEDYQCTLAPNGYYNDQGTLNVHVRGSDEDFWGGRTITICGEYLYEYMVNYCNYTYDAIRAHGATPLMSWTPLNINAMLYKPDSQEINDFQTYIEDKLNIPVISDIHGYFYTGDHFFDDDYHLSYTSRLAYTEQVAADLNAYFAQNGESEE